MYNSRLKTREEVYSYQGYVQNPIEQAPIIQGYFYKQVSRKSMAIRKINITLCIILGLAVAVAFVSYYFAMSNEITLNTLNRQITALNDENGELQNKLDRLKSFNNVDNKMSQENLLQKADKVIEVSQIQPAVETKKKFIPFTKKVDWAIGY